MPSIDLNADIGEECGDDAALLAIVTTASVATGAHAGGGAVLDQAVRLAVSSGVMVGAHPSYPDRAGFGRTSRAAEHGPDGISVIVQEQVARVARTCTENGTALSHVKAHGALYADVAADILLARAFLAGVERAGHDVDTGPIAVMGQPGTVLSRLCEEHGVPFLAESFADRAYAVDGSLVPRHVPGSVIDDPAAVASRALSLALDGGVHALDGTWVEVPAVTVCLHGDTPGAVTLARRVRAELESHGVRIAPARPQA